MYAGFARRSPWLLAAAAGAVLTAIALIAGGSEATLGQASPTPSAGASPSASANATGAPRASTSSAPTNARTTSAAPAIDNETAVRTVLPASIRDSERLPVRKWARADMPYAAGGYVVFITTIYPLYDGNGGSTEWLLTNYLQWDGTQWLIAAPDYAGFQLTGENVWLARNLTDISALPSPPEQSWQVFTVGYSADGPVSPTLTRTETVVEIYDLALDTSWSRVDYLRETDTSNPAYVEQRGEDVDWVFQDIDRDGIDELIATVVDTDTITPTGSGSGAPPPGTTSSTTTETWKWINGVYVLQGSQPAAPSAPAASATPAATPTRTAPVSATVTVSGTATAEASSGPSASPTASPTPGGRPAG